MRMSELFGQTLREAPSNVEVEGHKLLLRAAYVRQAGAGIFTWLPLGWRVVQKVCAILREEMEAIGAQEMALPVVNPAEIWRATGRWYSVGSELTRFRDRNDRDLVLSMTHEEAVAQAVAGEISSYRQLPCLIYHIQTKWRDDPRPRAGLIRVREFTMKDSYSLDVDEAGLDQQYRRHYDAYHRIFSRCGIESVAVESDVGMMGGKQAHEFMYLTPIGEDTILMCSSCEFRANRQIARFQRTHPADVSDSEPPGEVQEVHTPGARTIEELAQFLGIPQSRTAKMVFMIADPADDFSRETGDAPEGYPAAGEVSSDQASSSLGRGDAGSTRQGDSQRGPSDDGHSPGIDPASGKRANRLIAAIIRGDLQVNETKLAQAGGAGELRPALEDEIRAAGGVPGYATPSDLSDNVTVIADESVPMTPNLVSGANKEDYHRLNMNYGRDFTADVVADIASASEGDLCPDCGAPLDEHRAVEVGNIFKLGTFYSESLGCYFLDANGERRPVIMGSYGIGVGRLVASIAEEHRDEAGLAWPASVAPYSAHLVALKGGEQEAEALYRELTEAGIECLYDDRQESPGTKFMDADLIGIPIRITVSKKRVAEGTVEIKPRRASEPEVIPRERAAERIRELLGSAQPALT